MYLTTQTRIRSTWIDSASPVLIDTKTQRLSDRRTEFRMLVDTIDYTVV